MYMVAQRGATSPLKVTTIEFYEDLASFMQKCHVDYINECAKIRTTPAPTARRLPSFYENLTFGEYLMRWFAGRWHIYECVPTPRNKKTGKSKRPINLCAGNYWSQYRTNIAEVDKKEQEKKCKLIQIARDLGYDVDN